MHVRGGLAVSACHLGPPAGLQGAWGAARPSRLTSWGSRGPTGTVIMTLLSSPAPMNTCLKTPVGDVSPAPTTDPRAGPAGSHGTRFKGSVCYYVPWVQGSLVKMDPGR